MPEIAICAMHDHLFLCHPVMSPQYYSSAVKVLSRIDFLGGGGEIQYCSACVAEQDMSVALYVHGIQDLYKTHTV